MLIVFPAQVPEVPAMLQQGFGYQPFMTNFTKDEVVAGSGVIVTLLIPWLWTEVAMSSASPTKRLRKDKRVAWPQRAAVRKIDMME